MIRHEDIDDGALTSKLHKVWPCPSRCVPCNFMFHPCRKAVSGKKRRFIKDGFDLDLAPVTPRIIVHGFPATGIEHLYRNPRYEIRRYMDTYHKDHYKVYNFCCEPGRGYSPEVFHGRVERYPFKDHNTPPLATMAAFADSAKAWLDEDANNVVNIHCKAGKGRAGLMCCVLLVRMGAANSAKEAMDIYDRERVTNNRGLTVCSQRKYVIFYEQLWRKYWNVTGNIGDVPAEPAGSLKFPIPEQPAYALRGIEILGLADTFSIRNFRVRIYRLTNFLPELLVDSGYVQSGHVAFDCECTINENFKVYIDYKKNAFASPLKIMELLHNTLFMDRDVPYMDFPVDQLDIKKKVKPKLGPDVKLRLKFATGESTIVSVVGVDGSSLELGQMARNDGYDAVASDDHLQGIEMKVTDKSTSTQ